MEELESRMNANPRWATLPKGITLITATDPTGLLVATPVEGDPNLRSVREYKGY
jgi:hypothetical protein